MEKKIIGFSLNFDWLSSVVEVDDIENLENIDRFLCEETDELLNYITDKGGRVSIFVVGKDLMRPIIAKYIKKWFEDGHEIGNHSWSHPVNFGELSQSEIKEEIFKTEQIILKTINKKSEGFISPSWSSSILTFKTLLNNDFTYDHSIMPSIQNIFLRLMMALKSKKRKESITKIISWRLLLFSIRQPTKPYVLLSEEKKMIQVPLPTIFKLFSYWYTPDLLLSFYSRYRTLFLKKIGSHVVFHPADYCSFDQISNYKDLFPQSNIELGERKKVIKNYIDTLYENNYQIITMKRLVSSLNEIKLKNLKI
jgi:peptidoglycan/xylan/chitin deacetylase (PgdA/CDA1 family)